MALKVTVTANIDQGAKWGRCNGPVFLLNVTCGIQNEAIS